MSLAKLKKKAASGMTDREKVSAWLDWAGVTNEQEREEVMVKCKELTDEDKGARAYYVRRYEQDCVGSAN